LAGPSLALAGSKTPEIVRLAIEIAKAPAPTGQEQARAMLIASLLRDRGLIDVQMDEISNVVGRIPGSRSGPPLLVAAHSDTVFPLDTPLRAGESNGRAFGPGIGDNSLGVAAAVSLPRLFDALGVRPAVDVLITGNVGEEGLGDLRGIRRVMDDRPEIGAVIAVEGHNLGRVTHVAVGSRRLKVRVTGEGGHSWGDFGASNAIHGAAEIIHELCRIPLPANPKTTLNVGVIEGGTSINTIASQVWFNLDLRSVEAFALRRLSDRVERVLAAHRKGLDVSVEIVGDRPAGVVPPDCRLVRLAVEVLEELDIQPAGDASSTDANIPISRGVPAVCIGLTSGGNVHREDEYIDLAPVERGVAQLMMLVLCAADELHRGSIRL
jgi:acetylornithine deacetylase/succinyl-diaminopimelate desuccinylase-like protein